MLRCPGFIDLCRHWINREDNSSFYDGEIWKQYMSRKDEKVSNTIVLMLNVDWFRPFKHLIYSVGVMYLAVMNLPRMYRFKKENILTVGIMPRQTEPKCDINSFLEPLVSELQDLQDGVTMNIPRNLKFKSEAYFCLLLVICQQQGKSVFFLSYSGCSKCLKEFHGKPGMMDCSGFNRSE